MLNHEIMMMRVGKKISDSRTLSLIASCLKQDVMHDACSWTPEEGAPQGAVLSPLLSNIYLDPLDHLMKKTGFEMVRYVDDWVVLFSP
jgi:RNA-directed DNA polymerase